MTYNTLGLSELLAEKGYIRGPFGSSLLRREMLDSGEFAVYEQSNAIKNSREFRFFIDRNKFDELKRFAIRENDLIISCSGTVGRISKIEGNPYPGIISQALLILRSNEKKILPDFLKYFLQTKKGQHEILNASHGSVQVNIAPRKVVERIPIPCPDIKTQDAICKILLAFDKKIELNQQMNKTLEDIAKTLFKSWFIDFAPLRAKVEGRPSGLTKEISDLFPDSFEDSEFGEIPKGWQIKEIQELCESISSGGTPKRKQKDYWENGTIDWFKTGELLDTYLLESEEKITDSAVRESSCKLWNKGTILFAIYASPTVGRLGILTKPSTSNQAAAGLIPKESVGMPFLKNLLLFSRKEMQHIASGAAQQNINVGILKEFKVISPNDEIAGYFSKINEPIEKKIFSNLREISYLSQIRDLLLPKLISGELKISDAENLVEEAGI